MGLCFAGTFAVPGHWTPALAGNEVNAARDASLKRDAEIAWRFFTAERRGVDKGLVPAAMWPEGDSYGTYDILTMWDMASLILANVSARSIDLISEKEFDQRTKAVMTFLRRSEFRFGKLNLPNFRTGNSGNRTIEAGYDATDTGRLLIALHILDKATNGAYQVKQQVERWDLAGTVVNGKLQDIKSSSRYDSKCFNYVHYIARAYGLWGVEAKTGFDLALDANDADARAAFLKHVASIGPIATEPCATEAIELGHSARSRILADTLYAAQKERYSETGHLTCVSEAPIDKQPWFTYQGYNIDASAGPRWPVDSAVTAQRWKSNDFAETFRMISSKAAYLWTAERGDDYAFKLRDFVLAKAPTERFGFTPGVYEHSGRPVRIMDVNSNGAVLESVAYVLSGRKPLAEIRL